MKRSLLFVMLALLTASVTYAQPAGLICAYSDPEGTSMEYFGHETYFDVYIIVFVESPVTGAAYKGNLFTFDVPVIYLGSTYPDYVALAIGDIFNGVELGFSGAEYGFGGATVLLETLHFFDTDPYDEVITPNIITMETHPNYPNLVYGDGVGMLGFLNSCVITIPAEDSSFSQIKSMFQ